VRDAARLAALARAAADRAESGMTIGLGPGSTAEAAIRELARRAHGGLAIRGVPTSRRTAKLARELGIRLVSLEEVERIDLGIDGADEIDPELNATKGRGGALLHEKLVALACDDYLRVAAAEKRVDRLGTRTPLPVEVVPFGWRQTAERLGALGLNPSLRTGDDGAPVRTDGGHLTFDCASGPIADAAALGRSIKEIAGVVDHGLFVGIARRAFLAEPDGTITRLERPAR